MQNPLFDIAQDSTSPGVLSLLESDYRNADDILRLYLSALTGLDPTVVRKRWLQKNASMRSLVLWNECCTACRHF